MPTSPSPTPPARTWAGRLFYRGPRLAALEDLAASGALDESAPVRAIATARIQAPREVVWQVLSDLASWPALGIGVSAMTPPATLAPGQSFRWTNAGLSITSRLAVVEPGHQITWIGRTHGINAVHRQRLHDAGDGATVLRSEETMAAPLLSLVYPSAKLARDLHTFINGIKSAAQTAVAR